MFQTFFQRWQRLSNNNNIICIIICIKDILFSDFSGVQVWSYEYDGHSVGRKVPIDAFIQNERKEHGETVAKHRWKQKVANVFIKVIMLDPFECLQACGKKEPVGQANADRQRQIRVHQAK